VSVIIPVYNRSNVLPRALRSVARQTFPADEVLVVDDGSTEDICQVASLFDPLVTVMRKPNGGAASARNLGVEHATGSVIAFLDVDDYWEPVRLERQLTVLKRHPEVGFVTGSYYTQAPDEPRIPPRPRAGFESDRPLRPSRTTIVSLACATLTSCVLVKSEVLGLDRFQEGLQTAEDRDLWIRLLARSHAYFLSEPLATAVLEPGSLSRRDPDRDYPNMLQVIARHRSLIGSAAAWGWRRSTYRGWAAAHLAKGNSRRAIRPAAARIIHAPWQPEGWWVLLRALAGARRRSASTPDAR
jgi:glycosyltransferase involved in cell wall biosynthesis